MPDPVSPSSSGFEWDAEKNRTNLIKHGISFDDASQIFYGLTVVKRSKRSDGSQSGKSTIES